MPPPPLPWSTRTRPERLLLVFAASAAMVAGLLLIVRPAYPGFSACVWKCVSGLPCAGCGGTRALSALAGGSFLDALAWNPGAVFAGLLLALASLYAACVLAFCLEPWRPAFATSERAWWKFAVFAAVAGNWVYLLCAGRV